MKGHFVSRGFSGRGSPNDRGDLDDLGLPVDPLDCISDHFGLKKTGELGGAERRAALGLVGRRSAMGISRFRRDSLIDCVPITIPPIGYFG